MDVKQLVIDAINDGQEGMSEILAKYFGDTVTVFHATDEEGKESILKHGLKAVPVKNRTRWNPCEGFYLQVGKSDYVGSDRPFLLKAVIPTEQLFYADVDTDNIASEEETAKELGLDLENLENLCCDIRDFACYMVKHDFDMEGLELFFDSEIVPDGFSIKMEPVEE